MTALIVIGRAELVTAVVLSLAFIVQYVTRSPWRATATGRQLVVAMVVGAVEASMLSLIAFGVRVPIWVPIVVFGLVDLALIRWLVLLRRVQREHERAGR